MSQDTATPTGQDKAMIISHVHLSLSRRAAAARAVSGSILEHLPTYHGLPEHVCNSIDYIADLSCAVNELLDLLKQDVDRLEILI